MNKAALFVCGIVAAVAVSPHLVIAKSEKGSVWEDAVCKTPDETPQCVFRTFFMCGPSLKACQAAGLDVSPAELGQEVLDNSAEERAMKERPWTFPLGTLADSYEAGVTYFAEVGPRAVGRERFNGVGILPINDFPVVEMAIMGDEDVGCWSAQSVFVAQRPDKTWKVVGYAYWHEQDGANKSRRIQGGTRGQVNIDGLHMPWPDVKFHGAGFCGDNDPAKFQ